MIKLFDYKDGVIIPSIDVYNIGDLKAIVDNYPEQHIHILSYIFYVTCPSEELNPFFNLSIAEKKKKVAKQVGLRTSLDSPDIIKAIDLCKVLYTTPMGVFYEGSAEMLIKMGAYLRDTDIIHGRDGNMSLIMSVLKDNDKIRNAYKSSVKDLKEEQKSSTRGGEKLAYDQL